MLNRHSAVSMLCTTIEWSSYLILHIRSARLHTFVLDSFSLSYSELLIGRRVSSKARPSDLVMSQPANTYRIGIVGAGNMGEPLARLWTQAGHTVKLANSRGPETLAEVAQRTGATAATVEEAVKDAAVIVVAIPLKNVLQLDKQLFSHLQPGTVVIDTCNYYPYRDGQIDELDSQSLTESGWVAKQLGHPVIKAFNNIYWNSINTLGKPAGTAGRIALPIAGDSSAQKVAVAALIDQLGFDVADLGKLDESWRQQPGSPVYCCDYDVEGVKAASKRADKSRLHGVRDLQTQALMAAFAANTPQEQIPVLARNFIEGQYNK